MDNMELIQIIYDILIFGGALLLVVIAISFLISRTKKKEIVNSAVIIPSVVIPKRVTAISNSEQFYYRKNSPPPSPVVYQIDPRLNRDVRILRKPTVTKQEIQERIKQEEKSFKHTNGNGKRYTIVNEEMNKSSRAKVMNFYSL